LHDAVKHL
jgi:hypothetical protein